VVAALPDGVAGSPESGAGHLARAALESIAFQTADVLEAMHADSGIEVKELRVDGGVCQSDLLMQFQADILDVPILRPQNFETTALGAAYLAGLAVGFWRDAAELENQWQVERRFEPRMSSTRREVLKSMWREAVGRSRNWVQAMAND